MKLTRCSNGHYYDSDKFSTCPHCGEIGQSNETISINDPVQKLNDETVSIEPIPGTVSVVTPVEEVKITETVSKSKSQRRKVTQTQPQGTGYDTLVTPPVDNGGITIASEDFDFPPVVGWLVCVEGNHYGEDFRIKAGKNFIGRMSSNDVILSRDQSVSRERHAIVIYEPNERIFLLQSGDSHGLLYCNGKVVLQIEKLEPYDELKLGNSKLLFVPLCNERFDWQDIKKEER